MRAVIENERDQFAGGVAKREHRKFRIERPGRAHEIGARANPINLSVVQQHPAVLAHGGFLTEGKVETGGDRPGSSLLHRGYDGALDAPGKDRVGTIAMHAHRAWRMM